MKEKQKKGIICKHTLLFTHLSFFVFALIKYKCVYDDSLSSCPSCNNLCLISMVKIMKKTLRRFILFFVAIALFTTVVPQNCMDISAKSASNRLRQKQITITKSKKQVVDSLNGVKAYYRKGGNDGSSSFYSCAAYVKRYYKKVYDVDVNNLFYNRTPNVASGNGKFTRVKKAKVGDIVAMNTNHGTTHWGIVKSVSKKGVITLIEQNWKWNQGGSTVSVKNRKVKTSNVRLYRLKTKKQKKIQITLIPE